MTRPSKPGTYPYDYERRSALRALKNHGVSIEQDDGVHRCILFRSPHNFAYHFRLITWPGHLAISGDIGDFTFARTYDMFTFFANSEDWASMPVEINASYWREKITAQDRHAGTESFDEAAYARYLVREFRAIDRGTFEPGGRLRRWRDVRASLLERGIQDATEATRAAMDFTTWDHSGRDFYPFAEAWDCRFTCPSHHFLVCCYAIVWGIKRYAQVKNRKTQSDHDRQVLAGLK